MVEFIQENHIIPLVLSFMVFILIIISAFSIIYIQYLKDIIRNIHKSLDNFSSSKSQLEDSVDEMNIDPYEKHWEGTIDDKRIPTI